jgi:TorA maturation chaperone TorD
MENNATPPDAGNWIDLARDRANTYTLLSRVWGAEVDAGLWEALRVMEFPQLSELAAVDAAYRRLEKACQEAGDGILVELRVDYARLCLGSDPREGADPYESVHRNKEGLLMQDEWEAVLNLYRELGMQRSEGVHESEDHLALELECMAGLCERQAQALEAGELPEAAWWLDRQALMLDEHLLKWTPSFNRKVQALGQTEFYKAIGDLTEAYLILDRQWMA